MDRITPWLSVLMPVYNGARFLAQALNSVVMQRDERVEVVLVDDGSTDNSVAIAQSFADKLPISIISQAPSGNWLRGTNRALDAARGTFVSVLHQDDFWADNRVATLFDAMHTNQAVGMCCHPVRFVDDESRILGTLNAPLSNGVNTSDQVLPRLLVQNFLGMPSPLVRRSIAVDVGGFDESLWYTADWDLWLKVSAVAPVLYVDQALASFRIHAESQTITRSDDSARFREQLERCYERHAMELERRGLLSATVANASRLSMEFNIALAARAHRQMVDWSRVTRATSKAGVRGAAWYVRNSRIRERLWARLRLRLS